MGKGRRPCISFLVETAISFLSVAGSETNFYFLSSSGVRVSLIFSSYIFSFKPDGMILVDVARQIQVLLYLA